MVAFVSSRYKLTWRGATVARQVDNDTASAIQQLRNDIESYLKSTLHVWTGEMREKSFAEITAQAGGKRTLVVGSDAPHTLFHEFRYHGQLRETLDTFAPLVTEYLSRAYR